MTQFATLAHRAHTLRQVTRLWNWADHQSQPEPYWLVLRMLCPWAFRDPTDTNSIWFTY